MTALFTKNKILAETEKFVSEYFNYEGSGHDWWHIFRVRNLALRIAKREGGDIFVIEMAALLHDLEDWKLSNDTNHPTVKEFLAKVKLPDDKSLQICTVVEQVSFKGAGVYNTATTKEAEIVQDADRLDAIGAIGIARAFAYGGNKGRLIHDPNIQPVMHNDFESYKNATAPTINHFYEKLLLLKNRMNTKSAKEIALKRHEFMETYLNQFFKEWENKL